MRPSYPAPPPRDVIEELSTSLRRTAEDAVPWFLDQMQELVEAERWYAALPSVNAADMRRIKRFGFSDRQLAVLRNETEATVREHRWTLGVIPAYKMVDTCAGEFPSSTPYLYSSYDEENEAPPSDRKKVVILGGYQMPKAEIVAQIWIHHAIAHSYEASARWPIQ